MPLSPRGRLKLLLGLGVLAALLLPASESLRKTPWNGDSYWLRRYQAICEWDTRCENLRREDGWVEPSQVITQLLERLAPRIRAVARLYGVRPEALVGVLLAENSMNVTPFDKLQNLLVHSQLLSEGQFLGKSFSIGLGQINGFAAEEVESLAAQIEKRAPRPPADITQKLLQPGFAICYAAAILRSAQDEYARLGFQIADQPEILATLYNLGRFQAMAARRKEQGGSPMANAFGLFVAMHLREITRIARNGENLEEARSGSSPCASGGSWDPPSESQGAAPRSGSE